MAPQSRIMPSFWATTASEFKSVACFLRRLRIVDASGSLHRSNTWQSAKGSGVLVSAISSAAWVGVETWAARGIRAGRRTGCAWAQRYP